MLAQSFHRTIPMHSPAWTSDAITAKIAEIALETFGMKLVECDSPIKDSGLDSMALIDIVMGLEEHFGFELPLEKLPPNPSINQFVELVQASAPR